MHREKEILIMCERKPLSEWIKDNTPKKSNVWIKSPEHKIISSVHRPGRLKTNTKTDLNELTNFTK